MREIKPEDVPFWICTVCSWRGPYSQSDPVMYKTIDWQNCPSCNAVAIPDPNGMPRLRDGDPVVGTSDTSHFKNFDGSAIVVYNRGTTKWTVQNWGYGSLVLEEWRLPTKQELESAGYTEDQINEMMERWGTK